jgi:hypothetical protein
VRFGDVLDLLGFDLAAPEVPVGGTIRMTLYYRVRAQTAAIHSIGLRFESDDPAHAAALDASHVPVLGVYRTTEWTPGEYLRDEVNLRVDPNVRPGRMRARFSVRSVHGAIVPPDGAGLRDDLTFGAVTLTPADP